VTYRIEVERRARKELIRLRQRDQTRIVAAIEVLAAHPQPAGCVAVRAAPKDTYRIRIGDHRVIYVVLDTEQTIVVARIARRGEGTYRGLA
jgi:mRNA interferase RelE/StbE